MSHITISSLQYRDNLIENYQTLSDLPGFTLLESTDKQRGRYDIVAAYPYDALTIQRGSASVHDAFCTLQNMLSTTSSFHNLPFQGGAMGYISYDLGAALAGIDTTPHPLNNMPLIDMRWYDWAIVTDHRLKQVYLVAAHQKPETIAILTEIQRRWHSSPSASQPFQLERAFSPLISKDDYQQAFHAIHADLKQGRAYQVNYTQPFLAEYSGNSWEMYKRVRLQNPVPYSAFIRTDAGDILSFSPERFLRIENGSVLTSPIKGTTKRSSDFERDAQLRASLLLSEKNRAENVMIVDLMRNDLGKFAVPGSIQVTSLCEIQSFEAVHHLVSHIEALHSNTITHTQMFASCFPGGSISGAPKREAMRIISEHEPYSRGVYCGSIGYFSAHGRFDSNIAIRTITANEKTMYLPVGGGIVIDSNWEDEYRECMTKIEAIVTD